MRIRFTFVASSLAAMATLVCPETRADDRVDRLSEAHKTWLQKEVVYIITEKEEDVFLSLSTEEERNRLIEAFWRKRDQNPATPQNEYKEEHYRRFEYANQYFGRETVREGWRTDRGRYYILLGEPREIQRFHGYAGIVSSELWFYQSEPALGLPSFFNLLFYRKNDAGEYRLYSPVIDGPHALLISTQPIGRSEAVRSVQALRRVSHELAAASLSFDTSDPPDFLTARPSLGTAMMVARIEDSAKRLARADYADAWVRYGNLVSAEYSFNYIPSRSAFAILAEPGGTALIQYSVEIDPQNFTLETDGNDEKYYTTLDVSLEARNVDGVLVVAENKEVFIDISPSEIQQVQAFPFAYQDNFPLIPGDYSVTVVLRNRTLKQYAVAERELHVPDFSSSLPALSDLVLSYQSQLVSGDFAEGELRTFQIGALKMQPAAENIFVIGETVHVVTQAVGASPGQEVVFELKAGDELLRSLESPVGEDGTVIGHLALDGVAGGSYHLHAHLVSASGDRLSSKVVPLTVSPRTVVHRPDYVHRRGLNTNVPGLLAFARGEQLWNSGRFEEAKAEFERAVQSENTALAGAHWMLANAYLREERADEALVLLEPLEEALANQFEVVAGLGFAFYFKREFERAVEYLGRARTIRPPDTVLLNALGDSFQNLGRVDEAREAFERSLELDPNQPPVTARLSALE